MIKIFYYCCYLLSNQTSLIVTHVRVFLTKCEIYLGNYWVDDGVVFVNRFLFSGEVFLVIFIECFWRWIEWVIQWFFVFKWIFRWIMMFGRNFKLFACWACDADDTKQIFDRNRFDWKCSFVHFSLILMPEKDFKHERVG